MEVGLFLIHAVIGSVVAAHGSQKLFGIVGGHGLAGTATYLESFGLRPGRLFALQPGPPSSSAGSRSRRSVHAGRRGPDRRDDARGGPNGSQR